MYSDCAERVLAARISKAQGKPASDPVEELVSGGWIRDGVVAPVPAEEQGTLFTSLGAEKFPIYSWVRLQRGRLYKGDIGRVLLPVAGGEVNGNKRCAIIVIPRLHMYLDRKRKATVIPPAALMDVAKIRALHGDDSVQDLGQGFHRFGRHMYYHGFRLYYVVHGSLKPAEPNQHEAAAFAKLHLKGAPGFPALGLSPPENWRPGDKLRITQGALRGFRCRLLGMINSRRCAEVELEIIDQELPLEQKHQEVEFTHLRRYFQVGDNVRSLSGSDSGRSGIVTSIDDDRGILTFIEDMTKEEVSFSMVVRRNSLMPAQVKVFYGEVESYLPTYKHAQIPTLGVSVGVHRRDDLIGREVYVVSGEKKGWFGFVRSGGEEECVVSLGGLGKCHRIQQKHLVLV